MDAVNLLIETAEQAFWVGQKLQDLRREMRPGEFFDRLPEHEKEILRTLKSDDLKNIRPDAVAFYAANCHLPTLRGR